MIAIPIFLFALPEMVENWNKNYAYKRFQKLAGVALPEGVVSSEVLSDETWMDGWELLGFQGDETTIREWIRESKATHEVDWKNGPVLIKGQYFQTLSLPNIELNLLSPESEYCFVCVPPDETTTLNCVLVLVEPEHNKVWMYIVWD